MPRTTAAATALLLMALATALPAAAEQQPYAGLEGRTVKALSPEETRALLQGEGFGMALPAELNHYPGPRHVLDLADSLGLSTEQRQAASADFDKMQADARAPGERIVETETRLDAVFAGGKADEADLRELVGEIAGLRGALRYLHLSYHLRMRRLLTAEQIAIYDRQRGYAGGGHGQGHDHRAHKHGHGG